MQNWRKESFVIWKITMTNKSVSYFWSDTSVQTEKGPGANFSEETAARSSVVG